MRSDDNGFSDGIQWGYNNIAGPVDRHVAVKEKSPAVFFSISLIKELLNLLGKVNLCRYDFYN